MEPHRFKSQISFKAFYKTPLAQHTQRIKYHRVSTVLSNIDTETCLFFFSLIVHIFKYVQLTINTKDKLISGSLGRPITHLAFFFKQIILNINET